MTLEVDDGLVGVAVLLGVGLGLCLKFLDLFLSVIQFDLSLIELILEAENLIFGLPVLVELSGHSAMSQFEVAFGVVQLLEQILLSVLELLDGIEVI